MARTKQNSRKSTGGKSPCKLFKRKQQAVLLDEGKGGWSSDDDDEVVQVSNLPPNVSHIFPSRKRQRNEVIVVVDDGIPDVSGHRFSKNDDKPPTILHEKKPDLS